MKAVRKEEVEVQEIGFSIAGCIGRSKRDRVHDVGDPYSEASRSTSWRR